MTTWNMARMTATLATDLHCGYLPLGFVSRTLPFVPSHIPLYALVPATISCLKLKNSDDTYRDLEHFLLENVRFSPFFVLGDQDDSVLFPWKSEYRDRLEQEYLGSRYGVALDYETRGALENRLFEIEVILAKKRSAPSSMTRLRGYIFWKAASNGQYSLDSDGRLIGKPLADLIQESQWGGERNKGLGTISNVECIPKDNLKENKVFGVVVPSLDKESPALDWPGEKGVPFYLYYKTPGDTDKNGLEIQGKLMPLSGRRYDTKRGPGLKAAEPLTVWDMGWKTKKDISLGLGVRCCEILEK